MLNVSPPNEQEKPEAIYDVKLPVMHAGAAQAPVAKSSSGHTKSSCFLILVISDVYGAFAPNFVGKVSFSTDVA
jgi:hypothetical protein